MSGHGGYGRSDDEVVERYPHYKTYKACQSRAFVVGGGTLVAVAAGMFGAMDYYHRLKKPNFSRNWVVAGPIIAGIAAAYMVTMSQSYVCQTMWMALEERHSAITSAEERLAMRLKEENS